MDVVTVIGAGEAAPSTVSVEWSDFIAVMTTLTL
jgi:hypothetical protein